MKRDYDNTQDVTKTLVCYNAGCGRLQNNEWRKIRETRNYVKKINAVYPEIKNIYYVNVENPFASSILANGLAVIGSYKILDSIKNENHTENKEYLYWRESYI